MRNKIQSDIARLITANSRTWSATPVKIDTGISPPIFDEFDLPLLHIDFGNEDVDEYLMNDPFTDMRRSPITLTFYINSYLMDGAMVPFIDKGDQALKDGSRYMEDIVRRTDTVMKNYRHSYPRGLVQIIMTTVDYYIDKNSNPKVGKIVMEYASQYQITVTRDVLKRTLTG